MGLCSSCFSTYVQVSAPVMAYPGNLHALVARDQHLACISSDRTHLSVHQGGKSNEKLKVNPTVCRRSRIQPKSHGGVDEQTTLVEPLRLPVNSVAPAFRCGLPQRQETLLGAKAPRTSSCDYSRRMDRGICKVSEVLCATNQVSCVGRGRDCNARARKNELRVAKRLNARALSLRKRQGRCHALWLIDGVVRSSKPHRESVVSHPAAGRSEITFSTDAGGSDDASISTFGALHNVAQRYPGGAAEHLGVATIPRNPFRDEMTRRDREKDPRWFKATSGSGVLANTGRITGGGDVGGLVNARVAANKNCRVRYANRWHEIATLHRLLETGFNRRPARGTLDMIDRAMREAACESPSPGCLSRAQFVSTVSGLLDPCDPAMLHRLYSSFDPDRTDSIRIVDILACLLVTHKPETEALMEGLQQTFLRNLGALSSELHAELTKGNRQVCWRFLRRLYKHFQCGEGLSVPEIERLFQVCASSDEDFLQMSAAFNTFIQEKIPASINSKPITEGTFEQMFSTAFGLLDLFNTQMTTVQEIVKDTMTSD